MKYWRIFWVCTTSDHGDGYIYHYWHNMLWDLSVLVFAGYNHRALRKKSTTFRDAIHEIQYLEKQKSK